MRRLRPALPTALPAVLTAAAVTGGLLLTAPVAPAAAAPPVELRVATYNVSLYRGQQGELAADLADADDEAQDAEVRNVAEVLQRTRPDVVLLNEVDVDLSGTAVDRLRRNFLEVSQGGARPLHYPYALVLPSNTGVPSGHDLNGDGRVGGPDDAFGFGVFPGQYGFAVLSRYPIDTAAVRTFQTFRWADMPGNLLPEGFYDAEERAALRLSSKNHADVPVQVGKRTVHLLASHPTPPVFDGPEDRNGRRNADEIRFWADYVSPGQRSAYVYDDAGRRGGLEPGARFVVVGDLNSDPLDGDSRPGAVQQLLQAPRVQDPLPSSEGAVEAAELQGRANATHRSDPAQDTADFADGAPGNLRADYVLPSRGLQVEDAFVFWPVASDPLSRLTGSYDGNGPYPSGFPSSDHRLVAVDLRVPGA